MHIPTNVNLHLKINDRIGWCLLQRWQLIKPHPWVSYFDRKINQNSSHNLNKSIRKRTSSILHPYHVNVRILHPWPTYLGRVPKAHLPKQFLHTTTSWTGIIYHYTVVISFKKHKNNSYYNIWEIYFQSWVCMCIIQ